MTNKTFTIHCTVTNDLNQDQRMHRICSALVECGHSVVLVGRKRPTSKTLLDHKFNQKRLYCFFQKGFLFYAEYNIRLWLYLMRHTKDIVYSVDTDTLLAGYCVKKLKSTSLIYDAHEYFTEVPELYHRPKIKRFWSWIEDICMPKVDLAITVSQGLSKIFEQKWSKRFEVILNVPGIHSTQNESALYSRKYILYQGMLNQGRGLSEMMDALQFIEEDIDFLMIGEGDLSYELRQKAQNHPSFDRIKFLGWLDASEIKKWTNGAILGYNLLDSSSLSYFYSLSNKFFDYIHAEVPSINSDLPEYRHILNDYDIGYIVPDLNPQSIAQAINLAIQKEEYEVKKNNCKLAKSIFNWDIEKQKLIKLIEDI